MRRLTFWAAFFNLLVDAEVMKMRLRELEGLLVRS